jgi:hypothetical protein
MAVFGFTLFIPTCSLLSTNTFADDEWNIDEVNAGLQIPVPTSASNIMTEGHDGRGGYLRLTFDSPADEANAFAAQFCAGVLYQGYDPFNAINVGEPFTYTYYIQIDNQGYYSYSPNTSAEVLGNRCALPTGQIQIKLDTTGDASYQVTLDRRFSICDNACFSIPLQPITPFSDSPIEFLALSQSGSEYTLTEPELCFGVEMKSEAEREQWSEFAEARIEIEIDGRLAASATIGSDGTLIDRDNNNTIDAEGRAQSYYYCLAVQRPSGIYPLTTTFFLTSGETKSQTIDLAVNE